MRIACIFDDERDDLQTRIGHNDTAINDVQILIS